MPQRAVRKAEPPAPLGDAWLELPDGRIQVIGRQCRIGRASDNDAVLLVPDVSRHHAKLAVNSDGAYELTDLASTNGTTLNGATVSSAARLKDCDVLCVGGVSLRFRRATGDEMLKTQRRITEQPVGGAIAVLSGDALVAAGIEEIIRKSGRYHWIGCVPNSRELMAVISARRPDVVVIAETDELASPLTVITDGKNLRGDLRFAHLLGRVQPELVAKLLDAGVSGCALKDDSADEILKAIAAAAVGSSYLSRRIAAKCVGKFFGASRGGSDRPAQLSDRELEVFRLIGLGRQNREIAQELGTSVKTIEAHKENLKTKLGLKSSVELYESARAWLRN